MYAMDISIGTTTYKKSGRFISKSESIDFNEYIVPSFDIENIEDTIASVILGIETFDKYGNTSFQYLEVMMDISMKGLKRVVSTRLSISHMATYI